MNYKNKLSVLRILAFMEGISYLSFIVTMPLKYNYNMPTPNRIVGMTHGLLFVSYVIFVFLVNLDVKWNLKKQSFAYLASLIPFGTFVADAKIFKRVQQKDTIQKQS